jgi:hypothetical protein
MMRDEKNKQNKKKGEKGGWPRKIMLPSARDAAT